MKIVDENKESPHKLEVGDIIKSTYGDGNSEYYMIVRAIGGYFLISLSDCKITAEEPHESLEQLVNVAFDSGTDTVIKSNKYYLKIEG